METKDVLICAGVIGVAAFIYYNYRQKQYKPKIYLRKTMTKNYNARTIPPFGIFLKESEKDNKALIEHELVHWKQYQKGGLINYYVTYSKQLKKFGYDAMPMEREARGNETAYCKDNYTECVRTGTAKTVFNPSFRA